MNDLFATWYHRAAVDLPTQPDPIELLSRAREGLVEISELKDAVRLVDLALGEVSAWFAAELRVGPVQSFV